MDPDDSHTVQQHHFLTSSLFDLVNLTSSQIKRSCAGDPLGLQAFINSANLIETIVAAQTNAAELPIGPELHQNESSEFLLGETLHHPEDLLHQQRYKSIR